jgi:hypothetical protein
MREDMTLSIQQAQAKEASGEHTHNPHPHVSNQFQIIKWGL